MERLIQLRSTLLVPIVLALLAAGCGSLTMGGLTGARVVVSGDAPDAAITTLEPARSPARQADDDDDDDEPEGEVEVEFNLTLVADDGTRTRLGGEEMRVRIDLQGETEAEPVNELIPASRYVMLEVVFTEIEAEVDAGLVIDGVAFTGEVDIELDGALLVSRPIDLRAEAGASVELVVDLNAPAWLLAVDPVTSTVDPSVFADLLAVVVR